jgi:hypothetical protein
VLRSALTTLETGVTPVLLSTQPTVIAHPLVTRETFNETKSPGNTVVAEVRPITGGNDVHFAYKVKFDATDGE